MAATTIYFLSADTPLTKSFWLDAGGELQKSSYPNVKDFTSHSVQCASLKDFHTALVKHASLGHCLVKGQLHKDLNGESRAGATKSDDASSWLCLDLDGAPYTSVKDFMSSITEFKDVAHIVQYSASSGVDGNTKLSAHVFIMMDAKVSASHVKTWLMDKNLTDPTLKKGITLSRTGAALHWPIDITACQNDKLLYIAPPSIGKGVPCTLKNSERIQFVAGKNQFLRAKLVLPERTMEQTKEEARELRNELRKESKLPPIKAATKWVGEHEVQPKPGQAIITGRKEDRGYVYFNLNGGDSWGYWHHANDPELIHNFKGEPSYLTKELLPDYYKDIKTQQKIQQSQPIEGGELVLAFRDKRTAQYWNGIWREDTKYLELHPAKSELQLNHWMQNHNLPPFDVIPVWDLQFNPQNTVIIDETARVINTYVPSPYFHQDFTTKGLLSKCPLIKRIMMHAISGGKDDETFETWLNWLAVIFQHRIKPKTAWVLHGTEGTGKGLIVNNILAPLLGRDYVQSKRASELEEKFNGWMEKALIAFIDEIKVSASVRKDIISGDLRNFITEDYVTIRGMNRAAAQIRNYTGLLFSSNEPDPVQIKGNDRRYNVGHFQTERLQITQREIDEALPKELEHFMQYIMTRKADVQVAATAIKNAAHAELVENNKTSIDVTTNQLANGDIMALWGLRMDLNMALQLSGGNAGYAHLYHDMMKREIKTMIESPGTGSYKTSVLLKNGKDSMVTTESKLTRDELLVIFEHCVGNMPKTPNKFTSMLKHRGIKTERIRIGNELTYGLRVEWRAPASWLKEMAAQFTAQEPKQLKRVK
jgi:hypothetical protein